jgi:uncharacterized protein YqeY
MSLKERLNDDLRTAMRGGDNQRRNTIRLALSSIRNAEIAARKPFDEDGPVVDVLRKEVKQRRDSIGEFRNGGREDLVATEQAEMEVLLAYLPQTLDREQILAAAREVIAEVGATGVRDKGKVMGPLLKRLAGQAEGRDVDEVVSELLTGG